LIQWEFDLNPVWDYEPDLNRIDRLQDIVRIDYVIIVFNGCIMGSDRIFDPIHDPPVNRHDFSLYDF